MAAIFVQNIQSWVDQRRLRSVFEMFGQIQSVDMFGPLTGHTKTAMIYFCLKKDAIQAAQSMNGAATAIGNPLFVQMYGQNESGVVTSTRGSTRPNIIKPASAQTLILVKNFKNLLDEESLEALFKVFGPIENVSIKKEDGKSLGYGYIDFVHHESAVEAIKHMDGEEIKGKKLKVAFVQRQEEREKNQAIGTSQTVSASKQNSVLYITNLPKDTSDIMLVELFKNFGPILSVSVKGDKGRSTAVGFVSFEEQSDAQKAISEMNGHLVGEMPLTVVFKGEKYAGSWKPR